MPIPWGLFIPAIAPAPAIGPPAIEAPLEYVRYPEEEEADGLLLFRGERELVCLAEPPPGDWKLPPLSGPQPVFALVELGDREHLLILDRAAPDDPFYDRLFFDADANRDLTDDPAVAPAEPSRFPGTLLSPPIDLQVEIGGELLPYSFRAGALYADILAVLEDGEEIDVEQLELTLEANCCYAGQLELEGRTHRLLLGDADVDGRFDETATHRRDPELNPHRALIREGDLLFLTTEDEIAEHHSCLLGDQLSVAGRTFDLELDVLGGKLTLEPVDGAWATLKLPVEPARMCLTTEDDGRHVMIFGPGREVRVPPGSWRMSSYQLYREDEQGDLWFLAAAASGLTPIVPLAEGQTASLEFGEPFLPAARVPENVYEAFRSKKQDRVEVEFTINGIGGEAVHEIKRVAGNKTQIPLDATRSRPQDPHYRIVKPTGKVVAQGTFEYG